MKIYWSTQVCPDITNRSQLSTEEEHLYQFENQANQNKKKR
jgi:hypothetical protein